MRYQSAAELAEDLQHFLDGNAVLAARAVDPKTQIDEGARESPPPTTGLLSEDRKHAYRYLLYLAMLDFRPLAEVSANWLRFLNPWSRQSETRRIRYVGAVAEWLQKLALFSTMDFAGFEEEAFWCHFQRLQEQYPEFGPQDYYRSSFDKRLANLKK